MSVSTRPHLLFLNVLRKFEFTLLVNINHICFECNIPLSLLVVKLLMTLMQQFHSSLTVFLFPDHRRLRLFTQAEVKGCLQWMESCRGWGPARVISGHKQASGMSASSSSGSGLCAAQTIYDRKRLQGTVHHLTQQTYLWLWGVWRSEGWVAEHAFNQYF